MFCPKIIETHQQNMIAKDLQFLLIIIILKKKNTYYYLIKYKKIIKHEIHLK